MINSDEFELGGCPRIRETCGATLLILGGPSHDGGCQNPPCPPLRKGGEVGADLHFPPFLKGGRGDFVISELLIWVGPLGLMVDGFYSNNHPVSMASLRC
jgi:hypothetical protein